MSNAFNTVFLPDAQSSSTSGGQVVMHTAIADAQVADLLNEHGGKSYNGGIYRFIESWRVGYWNDVVKSAYPSFSSRITCFAIDWLGRVFALDKTRQESGLSGVVLFEPGTGESLEIPCNIESFHDSELINYREEALAESFYKQWRAFGGLPPNMSQCVGYKKPLFLGGSDTVDNLEISDLDVYWMVSVQLINKVRNLPLGTPIGKVSIE